MNLFIVTILLMTIVAIGGYLLGRHADKSEQAADERYENSWD